MMIFYACGGEGPAVMELDDIIDNFLASEADVDVISLRRELEGIGWYTGVHDNGPYLVLNLVKHKTLLTLMPDAWDLFVTKGWADEWNLNHVNTAKQGVLPTDDVTGV